MRLEINKFLRFCSVGLLNTIIDFFFLILFFEVLNFNLNVSITAAFLLANLNSFYFNKNWTFKNTNPKIKRQYAQFLFLSAFGVFLNLLIINTLKNNFSVFYLYAKIIATIFIIFFNFASNRFLIFRNH